MLTLLFLIQGQAASPAAVLNRFEQFVKGADPLTVVYSVKANQVSYGNMTLYIDRPNRLRATLKASQGTLDYVLNESGALEINRPAQMYAQHPPIGRLYLPSFKVVGAMSYAISNAVILGVKDAVAMPNGKPTVKSKVMVGGVATDEVSTRTAGMGGDTLMKSYIDAKGRLMRYWLKTVTPSGMLEIDYTMTSYSVGKPIPANVFSTSLPIGFSPFGLARADFGIPQGDPMPDIQLQRVSGGGSVSLKSLYRGKNALIVVSDPEYPANGEMLRSVRETMKQIPNAELIVIGMRKDASSARAIGGDGAYFDPTGLQLNKLAVPGAPTFYLVRSSGTLAQMFFGFDGKWEELDKAIARLKV